MSTWNILWLHLQIFGASALALYGINILLNAYGLFAQPLRKKMVKLADQSQRKIASMEFRPANLLGRTEPGHHFSEARPSTPNTWQ